MFESNYCVSAPRPLQGNDFRPYLIPPPTQGKNRDAPGSLSILLAGHKPASEERAPVGEP